MIYLTVGKPGWGMSARGCPTCKQPLQPFEKCSVCINPHCSDATEHPRLSPAPAQEIQSDSVAAPAEVEQEQGTSTLEQFQRWLETKAHSSSAVICATEPRFSWSEDVYIDHSLVIAECRVATKLLMQFKQELHA